jgi:hypothetical protein
MRGPDSRNGVEESCVASQHSMGECERGPKEIHRYTVTKCSQTVRRTSLLFGFDHVPATQSLCPCIPASPACVAFHRQHEPSCDSMRCAITQTSKTSTLLSFSPASPSPLSSQLSAHYYDEPDHIISSFAPDRGY